MLTAKHREEKQERLSCWRSKHHESDDFSRLPGQLCVCGDTPKPISHDAGGRVSATLVSTQPTASPPNSRKPSWSAADRDRATCPESLERRQSPRGKWDCIPQARLRGGRRFRNTGTLDPARRMGSPGLARPRFIRKPRCAARAFVRRLVFSDLGILEKRKKSSNNNNNKNQ